MPILECLDWIRFVVSSFFILLRHRVRNLVWWLIVDSISNGVCWALSKCFKGNTWMDITIRDNDMSIDTDRWRRSWRCRHLPGLRWMWVDTRKHHSLVVKGYRKTFPSPPKSIHHSANRKNETFLQEKRNPLFHQDLEWMGQVWVRNASNRHYEYSYVIEISIPITW